MMDTTNISVEFQIGKKVERKRIRELIEKIFKKHPYGCNDNCVPAIEKEILEEIK